MFESFRRDLGRYWALDSKDGKPGIIEKLRILFHSPQVQAIAVYRFGSWVHKNVKPKPARIPLKVIYHLAEKTTHAMWGIHIDEGAEIGGGFYIGHAGDIMIGPVIMGQDCNCSTQVKLGKRSDYKGTMGVPKIGDRVYIGSGAIIFGGIEIGAGATIGPLTVVGRNVAPKSMVLGNPMKVMKQDWDNTHQIYGLGPVPDTGEVTLG